MLIHGGRLVDPPQGLERLLDVRISGGVVAEIGEHLAPQANEESFDARGAIVAPGFIDMHVHLREPGDARKETIASGAAAAAAGGFTAVAAMPNTDPPIDTPSMVAASAHSENCRVYVIAAITRARAGSELLDYAALARAGAVAFSDDGSTVMNARVLREAALAARDVAGCFISHCEDETLKAAGVMTHGAVSERLGAAGSPRSAEDVIVARDLLLARETGKAWHIAHLSTATSVALIEQARASGAQTTCEVTPHHLLFTDALVEELGAGAKVNPPLRYEEDCAALRAAVRSGTIDVFASDHAPHTQEEKHGGLQDACVGFSGLEIAIGAYAHAFPDMPLTRFVRMCSTNPARILGVSGGTLAVGSPGDVTVFADRSWRVDPQRFRSKGRSTPFAGMTLPRRALATVLAGRLVSWASG